MSVTPQRPVADGPARMVERPAPGRGRAAVAGMLSVAVLLAASELAAGLLAGGRSFVVAVGDVVIDTVPGWLERAVIATLGTADKPVLILVILALAAAAGAGLGVVAVRRFAVATAGLLVLASVGVLAALADPQANAFAAVVAGLAGSLAGVIALRILLRAAVAGLPAAEEATPAADAPAGDPVVPRTEKMTGVDRRRFVLLASATALTAGAGALGGHLLLSGARRVEEFRRAVRLPRPAVAAPPVPLGADLEIPGLTPLYVPNERFYRIDTALRVPQVDPAGWSLQVRGRVQRPFGLTYDELMDMPQIEADITLACVSNEVGGGLVGNARWQGVRLRDLLERAGLQAGATQVVGRSVDGFTAGFPTRTALDTEDAMVAVAMNGEPLPARHGFPARLVVPGLYGYVSATKWLEAIELRSWEEFDGYWVPRGWAKEGPVKTQSRIDTPAPSSTVDRGRRVIAGVAWAPTRGIRQVEVRIDEGPWQPAELAAALDEDTWRQWSYPWDAAPGQHVIAVRATDGRGETQTDLRTPVAPDGASGRHTIVVSVD